MIDKDFLQGCTDEKINKGVAWRMSIDAMDDILWPEFSKFAANDLLEDIRDYCSSTDDAMPIVFANKIGLRFSADNGWIARTNNHISFNESPLRALMEVYLLMSNEK